MVMINDHSCAHIVAIRVFLKCTCQVLFILILYSIHFFLPLTKVHTFMALMFYH